ncbi:precorrin-3B C(17)-methyltransferase [Brevibacillus dissolubilis]|uniref:precorrin-3B C(17)-methyltransferase n=1 Tax=Brevibacillus dissolubilis TaxID=1844116 RepID=UPI0011178950|nr:precorrin-3B C(17)-methyltransferase [Brevibacillus dissolubilis]
MNGKRGKILLIGFGPGHFDHLTYRARAAIEESQMIIGYNTYVDLIRDLLTDQEIVRTGMTEEVSRAQEAVRQAEMGNTVAVISSGDAGVYGMAGLVYEVLVEKGWKPGSGIEVEVIPGISAIQSCASLLGAPVMHDACTISLSDHLTPWATIAKRVEAAAEADFVIALYNPRSGRRTRQIVETQRILLKYRSPDTPVGLVKSAYRDRQSVIMTTLAEMLEHDIGMLTTVIIGNSTTFFYENLMITPRGYQRKYTLKRKEQPLKPHERLQEAAEPWALHSAEGYDASGAGQKYAQGYDEEQEEDYDAEEYEPSVSGKRAAGASAGAGTGTGAYGAYVTSAPAVSAASAAVSTQPGSVVSAVNGISQQAAPSVPTAKPLSDTIAPQDLFRTAMEALSYLNPELASAGYIEATAPRAVNGVIDIFEVGVSPGVATKRFTSDQMRVLADLTENGGEMNYTIEHQIILRIPQVNPDEVVAQLEAVGFLVFPIGQVAQVKACDFCDLEKDESIPIAEELAQKLDGLEMPKELKIGFNGCGMACYGAVMEDIGLVYRRGAYDLFLGGKRIGRNAHPGQRVAEGVPADQIIEVVEQVVMEFKKRGHIDERFHKFFKRVGRIGEFEHEDYVAPLVIDSVCGD